MEEKDFRYIEEDEIDLAELFKTVWKRRWFVVGFTFLITVGAIGYAYLKTPIYEAKALVEIGNYKTFSNNINNINKIYINSALDLSKRLNVLFIDKFKNKKKELKSYIKSISVPKKMKGFLEIESEGVSNALAKEEINELVRYMKSKDEYVLKDIKKTREIEIRHLMTQIENLKNNEIGFIDKKINFISRDIKKYKDTLELLNKEIEINKIKNSTVAMFALLEKRDINEKISELENILIELNDKKSDLLVNKLNQLIEKRNNLQLLLAPYSYAASNIVGEILTNDHPAKPKKKLIVLVAFITGLILSIFLVFFMEFVKGIKEEVKDEKQF